MHELRARNQSQQLFVRAISTAWRNGVQIYDPSVWLMREPEAEEKMLRDADIRQAIGYRKNLIAGHDWTVIPKVEASPRAPIAVHIGTELLKKIKHFTQARMHLARAFFSGARFARIHGVWKTLRIGDGKARTWWVPIRLEDLDKRMFRIVPKNDGEKITAHWERWNVAKQDWEIESVDNAQATVRHVYDDDQATLGYGAALREALGWWWYAKEHVFLESLQAVERFAQGIIHAKIDNARDAETGTPNQTLIDEWVAVLEDLRGRHVLVTDKNDDIEILHGNAEGYQLLESIRLELKATITTLILGANLPTTASEGGSYALGGVQENTTEALIQYDREALEETLSDDLLGCLWRKNWRNLVELGIEEECPLFSIPHEKREEPKERAEVATMLSGIGVRLATDDVLEKCGFRKPEEGEDVLEPVPVGGVGSDMFGGEGFGEDSAADPASSPFALPTLGAAKPEPGASGAPPDEAHQDTALNGAQVTAAADLIKGVVDGTLPGGTVIRMLVSMFQLSEQNAQEMVSDALAFTPKPPPVPVAPPGAPPGAPSAPAAKEREVAEVLS